MAATAALMRARLCRLAVGRAPLGSRGVTQACRDAVRARQPVSDWLQPRVVYHGGIHRSVGRSFLGRLLGRWRTTTIDLNFDFRSWARHEEASRHVRYWINPLFFSSSQTLRRLLFPDLAMIGAISAAISWHQIAISAGGAEAGAAGALSPSALALPPEPFALSGFALGLLVTFRVQACHGRYAEARLLWGEVVNATRDGASRLLCLAEPHGGGPAGPRGGRGGAADDARGQHGAAGGAALSAAEREACLRLLRTFARALKYHLTVDGCNQHIDIRGCTHAEVAAAKDEALRDELELIWGSKGPEGAGVAAVAAAALRAASPAAPSYPDALLARAHGYRPLSVLHDLGRTLAALRARGGAGAVEVAMLEERVHLLARALGGCERLLRTPIYTPFTHHTSRFLILWCAALPFAMLDLVGPIATAPVSLVVSFMLLGIEDIGSRIEMPWDTLPLWQYCEGIDDSVLGLRAHDLAARGVTGVGGEPAAGEGPPGARAPPP